MASNIKGPYLEQFHVLNTYLAKEKTYGARDLNSNMFAYLF